jgi:hypothetical protein
VTDIEETPPDWVLREAAKRSELSNDTPRQRAILFDTNPSFRALCRAIERHEAFKQKVSDALEAAPLIGATESAESFKARQDAWLNGQYRAALQEQSK